jgi:hypothetical protein
MVSWFSTTTTQPRTGTGRSQVQRALDRAECIGRYGTQDGLELLWLQEADSAMGRAVGPWPLDQADGVRGAPAAADREREHAVQEVEVVLDRLG